METKNITIKELSELALKLPEYIVEIESRLGALNLARKAMHERLCRLEDRAKKDMGERLEKAYDWKE